MVSYKKESLETLRQRIDLVEVLSLHMQLKRSGSSYKGLCPFHEEKTPSFMVQRGDTHYHCYGCGAHGDAIGFLMSHARMSFVEAVESLAERFHVVLEKAEEIQEKGPSKTELKNALEKACQFYHFALLHTQEGQEALQYLYARGLDLDFIRYFQIGYAPKRRALSRVLKAQGIKEEVLEKAGLVSQVQAGNPTRRWEFFGERITFPIRDGAGAVIGFSARKFQESTYGGKYINTPETTLFKKSKVLFGLSYSRQRIAKERQVIIVEGQIDALRLIHAGFTFTVAGQGTAFGEGHVQELLQLGVNQVYLALDADNAGKEAAFKIGDLFQRKGVEVAVVNLPEGQDPDAFLQKQGPTAFAKLLEESGDYLTYAVGHLSRNVDLASPSKKNELVQALAQQIRSWEHSVMVHESLRKLAQLLQVPESVLGVGEEYISPTYIKKTDYIVFDGVNPDRILEGDLLRWLFLLGESHPPSVELIRLNVSAEHFRVPSCQKIFTSYMDAYLEQKPRDLLTLAMEIGEEEQNLLSELMQKKVNLQKAEEGLLETIHKILVRQWMEEREMIKMKIHSGTCSEEEALELAKQFDAIKNRVPQVVTFPS